MKGLRPNADDVVVEKVLTTRQFLTFAKPFESAVVRHVEEIRSLVRLDTDIKDLTDDGMRYSDFERIWKQFMTFSVDDKLYRRDQDGLYKQTLLGVLNVAKLQKPFIMHQIFFDMSLIVDNIKRAANGYKTDDIQQWFGEMMLEDLNDIEDDEVVRNMTRYKKEETNKRARTESCIACGIQTTSVCGRCRTTPYCGRACQIGNWYSHSNICK